MVRLVTGSSDKIEREGYLRLVRFGLIGAEPGQSSGLKWLIEMVSFQFWSAPEWLFPSIWSEIDLDSIPIPPSHFDPESICTS